MATPRQIESGARAIAAWIGYNYESLADGRITDKGYKPWAFDGIGQRHFQGGKQDLRDLAADILNSEAK